MVTVTISALEEHIMSGMFTFRELDEKVRSLLPDVDKPYQQFVRHLQERLSMDQMAKAKRVLMWVCAASNIRLLNLEELLEATSVPFEHVDVSGTSLQEESPLEKDRTFAYSWAGYVR